MILPEGDDKAIILSLIAFKIHWCIEQIEKINTLGLPKDMEDPYKEQIRILKDLEKRMLSSNNDYMIIEREHGVKRPTPTNARGRTGKSGENPHDV